MNELRKVKGIDVEIARVGWVDYSREETFGFDILLGGKKIAHFNGYPVDSDIEKALTQEGVRVNLKA